MKAARMIAEDWFPEPLPPNVVIGERSWCYSSFSCLHYQSRRPCGVHIGKDSGIYHGTFFDLGPDGEVQIGNYCTLVGAIISTNSRVRIGDYVFIAHEVVLADSFAPAPFVVQAVGGSHVSLNPRPTVISIGANSWIGARAVLLSGASLGEGTIVGAGAVVDFEVPPFAIVAGNPATIVGWAQPSKVEKPLPTPIPRPSNGCFSPA